MATTNPHTAETRALLLIDLQEAFFEDPSLAEERGLISAEDAVRWWARKPTGV